MINNKNFDEDLNVALDADAVEELLMDMLEMEWCPNEPD